MTPLEKIKHKIALIERDVSSVEKAVAFLQDVGKIIKPAEKPNRWIMNMPPLGDIEYSSRAMIVFARDRQALMKKRFTYDDVKTLLALIEGNN